LIAEDNEGISDAYSKTLEKRGHQVTVTKNGEDCLTKYESELKSGNKKGRYPFDVVIVDQAMPKKDGTTLVEEILDFIPTQRIIFATAYKDQVLINIDKIRKPVEIFEKPFHIKKLIELIESKYFQELEEGRSLRTPGQWMEWLGLSKTTSGPSPSTRSDSTKKLSKSQVVTERFWIFIYF